MDVVRSHTGLLLGGRYRLLTPLGAGGMAVVWQAHDHVLGRTVAVKMVTPQQTGDGRARDRIRQEARAAAALSHPNIAQVYDYGEMDEFSFVVMELVPGGTLRKRLSAGPLDPRSAMRVCAEVAAALAAAHAEGLVHRDIKPANVMLAPTGAKVVDFGIAAVASSPPEDELLGTPAYLAPERIADQPVIAASDLYALGVVLHLMLTGRSPWSAEDTRQMLEAHVYIEPAPLLAVPGVPDYVIELCNRCLAKDPARRPSAQEAAAVLAHGAGLRVVADEPSPAADPAGTAVLVRPVQQLPPTPVGARPGRGRVVLWSAVAATVLLLAGVGGWLLIDRQAPVETSVTSSAAARAVAPAPSAPGSITAVRRSPEAGPAATPTRGQPVQPTLTRTSAGPGATATTPVPTGATTTPTATPTATATTTEPSSPRTFTSAGGRVEATCPDPATAEILSWNAIKPYKVRSAAPGPAYAPAVVFKKGGTLITMTVTCNGGEPVVNLTG